MGKAQLFKMIFVLGLISVISAFALGEVYELTKKPIQDAKDKRELEAIKEVVHAEFDNNPFLEKTAITTTNGKETVYLYPARKNGEITAIAMKTHSNNAFGGRMELIVGFFLDGTINTYQVTDQKETPGLGTKVTEDKFSHQFYGLHPKNSSFKVKQDGGEIDAVTAATISSRAVINAIKKAYNAYYKFSTGEE